MSTRIHLMFVLVAALAVCTMESARAGFIENNLKISHIHTPSTVGHQYSVHNTVDDVDMQSAWQSDCALDPSWLSLFTQDIQQELVVLESTSCS